MDGEQELLFRKMALVTSCRGNTGRGARPRDQKTRKEAVIIISVKGIIS